MEAQEKWSKGIGLTTALIAVVLAITTMLANGAHTEKVVLETRIADWWNYTHSNDTNARLYMVNERIAQLHGEKDAAQEFHQLYASQKKDSDDARVTAQKLEKDSSLQSRKAYCWQIAELLLETAIVLCSIALQAEMPLLWHLSLVSSASGVIFVVVGLLLR